MTTVAGVINRAVDNYISLKKKSDGFDKIRMYEQSWITKFHVILECCIKLTNNKLSCHNDVRKNTHKLRTSRNNIAAHNHHQGFGSYQNNVEKTLFKFPSDL